MSENQPSRKVIKTIPPPGKERVTNIYWDPDTNEIVVIHG